MKTKTKKIVVVSVMLIALCILGYSVLQYLSAEEANKENVLEGQTEVKIVDESTKVEVEVSSSVETPVVAPLYAITDENHPLFGILPGDITDEKSLNYLWQTYFEPAIYTVCNHGSFERPSDVSPYYMAMFVGNHYIEKNGLNGLEKEPNNDGYVYVPMKLLTPLFMQYFKVEAIDTSTLDEFTYNKTKDAIFVNSANYNTLSDYSDPNGWGIYFEHVTLSEKGEIVGELNSYYDNMKDLKKSYRLTLEPENDGSGNYNFGHGENQEFSRNAVGIQGNYEKIDTFKSYQDYQGRLNGTPNYLGETESSIIFQMNTYQEQITNIISIDKTTLKITAELLRNSKEDEVFYFIKMVDSVDFGQVILIGSQKKVEVYDLKYQLLTTINVPEEITSKMVETVYSKDGEDYEEGFFDYDIATDLSQWLYSDVNGVFLLNTKTNELKLIQEKIEGNPKFSPYDYAEFVNFVGQKNNIFGMFQGYEWKSGYVFYNQSTQQKELNLYTSFTEPVSAINDSMYYIAYEHIGLNKDGDRIEAPFMLNLENGNHEPLITGLENLTVEQVYDSMIYGNLSGYNGLVLINRNFEQEKNSIGFVDFVMGEIDSELVINNTSVSAIGFFHDPKGDLQILLSYGYGLENNENGVIVWHASEKTN